MKKRILSGAVAALLVAATFSGCGSKETSKSGENGEKIRIRMTYAITELDGQNNDLDAIFDEFYKQYPNTEIVVEEGGTSLMAKIAADDAPDIIRVSSITSIPTYANKNIIMPIDDLLAKSKLYNEDDIYELPLNAFRYDGKEFGKGPIYGLAKDWSPEVLWVNTDTLAEEGIPVPTMEEPWTYSEYREYAAKMTKKNGNTVERFGCEDDTLGFASRVEKMLNLSGDSMWSDDYKKINIKNNKAAYDMIKYQFDMQKAGQLFSKTLYSSDFKASASFVSGQLAMYTSALYSHRGYSQTAPDPSKIQICPTPVADGTDKLYTSCAPVGAVISAKTKNIDEVFACWEYIHLGELSERRAASGLNLPVKKSVADAVKLENEFMTKNYDFIRKYAVEDSYVVRINPYATVQAIEGVFQKYYDAALNDQYTFDEAIELIEKEVQILLDEGSVN